MKPLGRKHFKCKTGSKHHTRIKGKYSCWWEDVCTPNKRLEDRIVVGEILEGIEDYGALDKTKFEELYYCTFEQDPAIIALEERLLQYYKESKDASTQQAIFLWQEFKDWAIGYTKEEINSAKRYVTSRRY